MSDLIKKFKNITRDSRLASSNKKIKKILRSTKWGKTGENKNKRLELGNRILSELASEFLEQSPEDNRQFLKTSLRCLAGGFIDYRTQNTKYNSDTENLGIKLRQIWDILESHIGLTRKKFISLWAIYGIGLNTDFDIIDAKYLDKIIASNTLKIYYSIAVDDLADNSELNSLNKNVTSELLLIRNVILPRIFDQKLYTKTELKSLLKNNNIEPKRLQFISAIYGVIREFCSIDQKLPFFNAVKNKMLEELQLHLDACITTYKFDKYPKHSTLAEYMEIESRGMLMLSFFYTQTAGRKIEIADTTIRIKERITDYMQKSQRIINDINTWEREYNEKCYYNSVLVSALERKYITPDDLRKRSLSAQQLRKIKKDIIDNLLDKTIGYLEKIRKSSPENFYRGASDRVLWVGKIQKAFEGEI